MPGFSPLSEYDLGSRDDEVAVQIVFHKPRAFAARAKIAPTSGRRVAATLANSNRLFSFVDFGLGGAAMCFLGFGHLVDDGLLLRRSKHILGYRLGAKCAGIGQLARAPCEQAGHYATAKKCAAQADNSRCHDLFAPPSPSNKHVITVSI